MMAIPGLDNPVHALVSLRQQQQILSAASDLTMCACVGVGVFSASASDVTCPMPQRAVSWWAALSNVVVGHHVNVRRWTSNS